MSNMNKDNLSPSTAPKATVAENTVLAKDKGGFPFKKVVFILLIVLAVVSLVLMVLNIIVNSYFSNVATFDGEWSINTDKMNSMPIYKDNEAYFTKNDKLHAVYDQALLNYAQASSDIREDEEVFNYAIYGVDQFAGSGDANADVIMLVSVNKIDNHVTYLAFEPRVFVYIPDVGVGPMNDAYLLGGPQLLTNTIEQNYGLHINGFIDLNMSAFVRLIDEFGSIEFAGDKNFLAKVNEDIALFNSDKSLTGENAVPKATLQDGKVALNGMQTIAYLRTAGAAKSSIANTILKQMTKHIFLRGFGGAKKTIDIAIEEMTVSLSRTDVGPLVSIGLSVLESVETIPVGNMEGRAGVDVGVTCDYDAERAAVIKAIYLN